MDIAAMLAEFSQAYSRVCGSPPGSALWQRLCREEARELDDALATDDRVAIAVELADVVYVVYGAAHALGIPLDTVIAEVHRANMGKIAPVGAVRLRDDGKILKPDGWKPADVAAVLLEHEGSGDDAA